MGLQELLATTDVAVYGSWEEGVNATVLEMLAWEPTAQGEKSMRRIEGSSPDSYLSMSGVSLPPSRSCAYSLDRDGAVFQGVFEDRNCF
jgi:hypothetical protein